MGNVAIGSMVWVFESNRRVYRRNEQGQSVGGPIYREHFVEREIVGETRASWLVGIKGNGHTSKLSKKEARDSTDGRVGGIWLTAGAVDDAVWSNEHRYKIADLVGRAPPAKLREVAAILGYVEVPRG